MAFLLITCGHIPRSRSWITIVLYVRVCLKVSIKVTLYWSHMCNNYTLVLDVSCLKVCHFRISLECRERSFAMCQQVECVDTEMEPPSDICLPRTRFIVSREQSRPAAHVEFTVTALLLFMGPITFECSVTLLAYQWSQFSYKSANSSRTTCNSINFITVYINS